MKKLIKCLFALMLVFGLSACSGSEEEKENIRLAVDSYLANCKTGDYEAADAFLPTTVWARRRSMSSSIPSWLILAWGTILTERRARLLLRSFRRSSRSIRSIRPRSQEIPPKWRSP